MLCVLRASIVAAVSDSISFDYPELLAPDVQRPLAGVRYPHPSLEGTYEPGVTEPYIQQLVCALLAASGAERVLETGGFRGITSAWLAVTLEQMGGGHLAVCEIDSARAADIYARLQALDLTYTIAAVYPMDVLEFIGSLDDDSLDFAWVDDCHEVPHVEQEIAKLWPKMRSGGLILFHDVYGVCKLHHIVRSYGGYALDLPRLGPAGGVGILQKP